MRCARNMSLFQDDTLHFAVQVAEDSPAAGGRAGAEDGHTFPQGLVTPQTKATTSLQLL